MKNALALGILVAVVLVIWAIETVARRWLALIILCVAALVLIFAIRIASARDVGQWDGSDPKIVEWYRELMQPDVPTASCCGEADAYWADEIHVRQDPVTHESKTFAKITDDRPDEPLKRPHREIGEEFEIPDHKLKWDRSNPTGHAIVFLSRGGFVFCFVQGSGI